MGTKRKKVYEVLPLKPGLMGVGVNGKMMKFGKHAQMFTTHDAGLAKDIDQTYGKHGTKDVVVVEADSGRGVTPRKVFSIRVPWRDE